MGATVGVDDKFLLARVLSAEIKDGWVAKKYSSISPRPGLQVIEMTIEAPKNLVVK